MREMKPPTLSSSTAAALSITYTILYVLPFYLHPTTRPAPTLSRDSPIVIRTRIQLVTLSVTLCTAATYAILYRQTDLSLSDITHRLGFYPITLASVVNPLLLTAILFLGPLFEHLIVDNALGNHLLSRSPSPSIFHPSHSHSPSPSLWIPLRNYLIAPLTEELLFRSLLLALPLSSHPPLSPKSLILTTPLYFGIAHIHHLYEFRLTHPRVPLLPALVRSVVQFGYTSVFGWYAAFLMLRTGGVWGVVAVHGFCNWMGLPRVWGRVGGRVVREVVGGEGDEGDEGGEGGSIWRREERGVWWTVGYYVCLVGGAVAWWRLRWVLTECEGALVEFS